MPLKREGETIYHKVEGRWKEKSKKKTLLFRLFQDITYEWKSMGKKKKKKSPIGKRITVKRVHVKK